MRYEKVEKLALKKHKNSSDTTQNLVILLKKIKKIKNIKTLMKKCIYKCIQNKLEMYAK